MIEPLRPGRSAVTEEVAERKVEAAARTLALLDSETAGLRAELAKLRRDIVEVQRDFNEMRATQIVEANEQLVLAALHAETLAETANSTLDELARAAQRDPLTGMPNRALMLDRLERAIAMARRHATQIAVLFIDVDRFKEINDTLGHAVGDQVLKVVAQRVMAVVRDSDTVSRHGGDEFLVLLADVKQASDATRTAEKILQALAESSEIGGYVLHLSASMGIAFYPGDGEDPAALIDLADHAMYRSKRRRHGGFEVHVRQDADSRSVGAAALVGIAARRLPVGANAVSVSVSLPTAVPAPRLEDLRDANEQLVIAALGAQELEAHAEEAHRRQMDFLAMVAHELRNPLTPIGTAAKLLGNAGGDAAMLARLQALIKRQVAHMSRLVDDLLDGSRVGTGKFRLEPGTVEVTGLLAAVAEGCHPVLEKKHQHLTVELPPGPLALHGDAVRLTQVFGNLLENASKYTREGGAIGLAAVVEGETLAVTVWDDGIGIPADALPSIFDLFVQDTSAPTLPNRGLGIGLAVVRDLVKAHGGHVVARSDGSDLGSQFRVTLPLTKAKREPAHA